MTEYNAIAFYKSEQVAIAGPFVDRAMAERAAASYAERGWSVEVRSVTRGISLEKRK
jgi:hypothetical protein